MPRLREQERALAAYSAVTDQRQTWGGRGQLGEYRQELQQLPARILASGLGQTLAFYASRGSEVHRAVGKQVASFLEGREGVTAVEFLTTIMRADVASYRRHTREALAYAEWLKRYSAALIDKPDRER